MKYSQLNMHTKQLGFSLYMVLIIMVVIAFMVVATMQGTSMNSRTAANDSDYQIAFHNAQAGLKAAQEKISTWPALDDAVKFSCNCSNGLCAAKGVEAESASTRLAKVESCANNNSDLKEVWKRENVFSDTSKDPSIKSEVTGQKYRYVIEYLGPNAESTPGVYIFRVTAKGWGKNQHTTSLIEETLQANLYEH